MFVLTFVFVCALRTVMPFKVATSVIVTCEIPNDVTQLRYFPFISHKFYGHFSTKLCPEPSEISEVMFALGIFFSGTIL